VKTDQAHNRVMVKYRAYKHSIQPCLLPSSWADTWKREWVYRRR